MTERTHTVITQFIMNNRNHLDQFRNSLQSITVRMLFYMPSMPLISTARPHHTTPLLGSKEGEAAKARKENENQLLPACLSPSISLENTAWLFSVHPRPLRQPSP